MTNGEDEVVGKTIQLSCSNVLLVYIRAHSKTKEEGSREDNLNCLAEIREGRQFEVSVRQLDCLTDM